MSLDQAVCDLHDLDKVDLRAVGCFARGLPCGQVPVGEEPGAVVSARRVIVLWGLTRHVPSDLLPDTQTVVRIEVADDRRRRFWLLADPAHVEVCLRPPGDSDDAVIHTTRDALTGCHLGELTLPHAMRDGLITAEGAREVVRMFASWGGTGSFLRPVESAS